jgi:acyl carrier protein
MSGSYRESVTPAQLITGLPTGGMLKRDDLDPPFYYDDPRFLLMKKMDLDGDSAGHDAGSDSIKLLETSLAQRASLPEAARLISTALCGVLGKGLQTEAENIDPGKPLHTYGVDSLMAVEIRTWILQVLKADVSLFEVLGGGSIALLAAKIAASSKLVPVGLDTATRRGSLELFSLRKASVGA